MVVIIPALYCFVLLYSGQGHHHQGHKRNSVGNNNLMYEYGDGAESDGSTMTIMSKNGQVGDGTVPDPNVNNTNQKLASSRDSRSHLPASLSNFERFSNRSSSVPGTNM